MKRSRCEVGDDEWFYQNEDLCTHDGEPPSYWWGRNKYDKPSPMTNVVNLTWGIRYASWYTSCLVEGKQGKQTSHSVSKHGSVEAAFEAACETLRDVVNTASSMPSRVLVDPESKTLVVDKCTKNICKRTNLSIAHFAPDPIHTLDKFERFVAAMVIAGDADATHEERQEAVATMEMLRTQQCFHCRGNQNRSKNTGEHNRTAACKAMAEKIRADLGTHACCKCGKRCGRAMQCEHVGRMDKLFSILEYAKWATPELGPDAMWKNYKESTVVPICTFCHLLEHTHQKYRGADLALMPTTTYKEKQAKLMREYKEEKAKLNAQWKAERKCCFYCKRPVIEGEEHAFPWMHSVQKMVTDREAQGQPRLFKSFGIAVLQGYAICPATFTSLAKPEVDDKCELGCANCHMVEETLPELAAQAGRLKRCVAEWAQRGGVVMV